MTGSSFSAANNDSSEAQQALTKETRLPLAGWQQEVEQGLEYGLEAADSIRDRSIPNFSRGELPHYAGINTFLKAPYLENVRNVGMLVSMMWQLLVFPTIQVLPTVQVPGLVPRESGGFRLFILPITLN